MFKSIKSKFIFVFILFVFITVGAPIFFLIIQFQQNFNQRSKVMLSATVDAVANGINNAMLIGENKNIQQIVEGIANTETVSHVRILNRTGEIKYSSKPLEIGKNVYNISPYHIPEIKDTTEQRSVTLLKIENIYSALQPIKNNIECRGCHGDINVIAYLDIDTKLTQAEINFFTGSTHIIFLGGVVIVLLVLGLIYFFNSFVNKPILGFISALDEVEQGNLSIRLPQRKSDEFGKLYGHFNRMINEIQSSREKIEQLHFEQLRHANQLVTIGELTSQMAHEINNYTAIMMSRADFLLMEVERKPEMKNINDDLVVIQKEISKIAGITQNILRHSKKRKRELVSFNLVEVIEQSIKIFDLLLHKQNIKLIKEFSLDNVIVNGDPNEIEQLIINIITNALDSMTGDGVIIFRLLEENATFILEIEDNGDGMDAETLNNIYSPFFTTKKENKGTGLGLYIVKKICESNNIFIHCESKLNQGTTFQFTFPNFREIS